MGSPDSIHALSTVHRQICKPASWVFLVSLSRAIALALYSRYSELPHIWLFSKLFGDLPNNLIQSSLKHLFWGCYIKCHILLSVIVKTEKLKRYFQESLSYKSVIRKIHFVSIPCFGCSSEVTYSKTSLGRKYALHTAKVMLGYCIHVCWTYIARQISSPTSKSDGDLVYSHPCYVLQ